MVNGELVMELMKLLSANPETFPRILSAFVRRELLQLVKCSDGQLELIRNEDSSNVQRRHYIREHLEDLAKSFDDLIGFLEYFRDIPLGKNEEGIMSGEDVLLILEDIVDYVVTIAGELPNGNDAWRDLSEDEFGKLKNNAIETVTEVNRMIHDLDYRLTLAWTQSEEQPEQEPERELKADFEIK